MLNGTSNVWLLDVSLFRIPIVGRLCNQILGLMYDVVVRLFRLLTWFFLKRREKVVLVHFLIVNDKLHATDKSIFSSLVAEANQMLSHGSDIQLDFGEVVYASNSRSGAAKPFCNFKGWLHDLWRAGAYYDQQMKTMRKGFRKRSLCVVVVEDFGDGFTGCGLGPFTDYLQITWNHRKCLAHEVMHKLGLLHVKDKRNLMHPKCNGNELSSFQSWFASQSSFVN